MTRSQLRSPQHDLAQRRPVWTALSALFLDTALDETDIAALAAPLAQSPYTDAELAAIYQAEVTPVCAANIGMAPGWWACFPEGWIEQAILSRGLDAAAVLPQLVAASGAISWGWGGLQQRVALLRSAGLERW